MMSTLIGAYVAIISPLTGEDSGTGTIEVHEDATGMFGLSSPVWDGLLYFSRAEFRVIRETGATLAVWEPSVLRAGPYDHWYGSDEDFVRAVSRVVGKLV